ncbi:MAG: metallophosphoesterase family protein [Nitrososphaerota archaeon]
MKIFFVTDLHQSEKLLERIGSLASKAEILVVGGDVTTFGQKEYFDRFMNSISMLDLPILYVPGNNDMVDFKLPNSVQNIDGKSVKLYDYMFGGLGGSPFTPFNTPNEYSESQLSEKLNRLGKVDILVTHTPPYNSPQDTLSSGGHAGSKAVGIYIKKNKPRLVLCGHIHEAKAVSRINQSTIVNPGSASGGNYAMIELHEDIDMDIDEDEDVRLLSF